MAHHSTSCNLGVSRHDIRGGCETNDAARKPMIRVKFAPGHVHNQSIVANQPAVGHPVQTGPEQLIDVRGDSRAKPFAWRDAFGTWDEKIDLHADSVVCRDGGKILRDDRLFDCFPPLGLPFGLGEQENTARAAVADGPIAAFGGRNPFNDNGCHFRMMVPRRIRPHSTGRAAVTPEWQKTREAGRVGTRWAGLPRRGL